MTRTTLSAAHAAPAVLPARRAARAGAAHAAPSVARRGGFTLVELLVVLAIITLLLALTGAGIVKSLESQRNRSTAEQLTKLQQALDTEYERVVRLSEKDRLDRKIPDGVMRYCENDPDRAQAVWTAMKLRQHFPQTYNEAVTGVTIFDPLNNNAVIYSLPPLATFTAAPAQGGVAGLPTGSPDESAVLLYIILAKKAVGGGFAADDVTTGMQRDVAVGGQTMRTFADAWGNSVGFRRWEQNGETDAAPFADSKPGGFKDPLDPLGKVTNWADSTKRTFLVTNFGFSAQNPNAPNTNRNRVATVYSAGQNKAIEQPWPAPKSDDLVGYRLRRLGNRGN